MERQYMSESSLLADEIKNSVNSDMDNPEIAKLKNRIDCLVSKLKNACCEVAFLADRNARLESGIKTIAEVMKENNVNGVEVGGEKQSIDQYITKVKAGYLLSDSRGTRNFGKTGLVDGKEDGLWLHEVEDADLTITMTDDRGLSVRQMNEYETQIETLKTEIEVFRAAMKEAFEREQHYKMLFGQLEMAESRLNLKWGAFHNGVVQQWSSHCQMLQQQLVFATLKLRQISIPLKHTKTDDGNDGTMTPGIGIINFDDVARIPTVYPDVLSEYSDEQQQQQQQPQQQQPFPNPVTSTTNSNANQAMIPEMSRMQVPVRPIFVHGHLQNNRPASFNSFPPVVFPPTNQSRPGRMVSALRLQRYFSNMSLIEKAQREGRVYPPPFLDEEVPEGIIVPHSPRQARTFESGISNEQGQMHQQASSDFNGSLLRTSAAEFVPEK